VTYNQNLEFFRVLPCPLNIEDIPSKYHHPPEIIILNWNQIKDLDPEIIKGLRILYVVQNWTTTLLRWDGQLYDDTKSEDIEQLTEYVQKLDSLENWVSEMGLQEIIYHFVYIGNAFSTSRTLLAAHERLKETRKRAKVNLENVTLDFDFNACLSNTTYDRVTIRRG